ncbi:MAG: spoIID, partial [Cohnella sp.]|nr:spoIID [Cohnella sp.]
MEWRKNGDWAGFAIGIVLSMILWTYLHSLGNRELRSTAAVPTVTVVSMEPGSGDQSDKPANQHKNPHSHIVSDTDSTNNADSHSSTESGIDSHTDNTDTDSTNTANSYTTGVDSRTASSDLAQPQPRISVHVYLTGEQRIETVPLETYVRGVVAAEMPTGFESAALEAQAMAARTYIVRRLLEHDNSNVPVQGAEVTDTQTHQVYRAISEMQQLRSRNPQAWRKADDAVRNTQGQVITYQGRPIQALYFSASNGYTENSEDVFPFALPYLRSVASPWEQQQQTASAAR